MTRPLVILAAAALAAGGSVAVAAPAQAAAVAIVHVRVTADHHLVMPSSLPAGVERFPATGPKEGDLQLVRPEGSAGPQQLVDDGDALNAKEDASGIERGVSALACFWPDEHGVPHAAMSMVRSIHLR